MLRWQESPDHLNQEIDDWWDGVQGKLDANLQAVGAEMRAYAQLNHPWTNRTGEAEAGLNFEVTREGDTYILTIYHTASHGLWLEVRWGGRWGIIPDALQANYGRVMSAVMAALR